MVTQADLEKRAARLRDRIQKAGEDGDRPLPPDGIRRFRKRLKRVRRKISARAEKLAKLAKSTPAEENPPEVKAAEEKAPEAQAAVAAPEEKAPEEGS